MSGAGGAAAATGPGRRAPRAAAAARARASRPRRSSASAPSGSTAARAASSVRRSRLSSRRRARRRPRPRSAVAASWRSAPRGRCVSASIAARSGRRPGSRHGRRLGAGEQRVDLARIRSRSARAPAGRPVPASASRAACVALLGARRRGPGPGQAGDRASAPRRRRAWSALGTQGGLGSSRGPVAAGVVARARPATARLVPGRAPGRRGRPGPSSASSRALRAAFSDAADGAPASGDRLLRVVGGAADRAAGTDGQVEGDLGGHPLEPGLADLEPGLLELLAVVDGGGELGPGRTQLGAQHHRTLVGGEPVGPLGDQPDHLLQPGGRGHGPPQPGGQAGHLDGEHGQPGGEAALLDHQVRLGDLVGRDPGRGRHQLGLAGQQCPGVGEQVAGLRLGGRQVGQRGLVQVQQSGRGDGGTERRLTGPVALLARGEGQAVQRGHRSGPAGQLEAGPAGRLGRCLVVQGARSARAAATRRCCSRSCRPASRAAAASRSSARGRGPDAPASRAGGRGGAGQVGGPVRELARAGHRGQVVVGPAVGQRHAGRLAADGSPPRRPRGAGPGSGGAARGRARAASAPCPRSAGC